MKSNEVSVSPGLWVGLLLPPLVWAGQMQINYVLVRYECTVGKKLLMLGVVAVALVLIFLAFVTAFLNVQLPGFVEEGFVASRKKFVAAIGLLSSAIFFLVVLAQGIAVVVFHPCQL